MAFLWISDTVNLSTTWTLISKIQIIYYGLSLFSTQLAGNKYVNYVLSGLVEAPSNLVSPWLLNFLGRRFFISSAHLLAAFAFLCYIYISKYVQ